MHKIPTFSISLISLAVSISGIAQTNLISNGGFELPVYTSATIGLLASWDSTDYPAVEVGQYSSQYPPPQEGHQYLDIGTSGNGTHENISQSFTVVTPGNYTLSWFDTTPLIAGYTDSPY